MQGNSQLVLIHRKMSRNYHIIIVIFGIFWVILRVTSQGCNVCQSNSAACINESSFYLCYGGALPFTDQIFNCADGLVCSDQPNICFQSNGATASCGDTSSCGLCNENQVFACTSRTTFAFCFGATRPTDVNGTCPTGWLCDASTQNICVPEATNTSVICNLDHPIELIPAE